MATWVVHFRVADYFLKIFDLSETEFIEGSVAPDCGYGEKDSMGKFDPPPSVTHWSPSGIKKDCRIGDFYDKYLRDRDITTPDFSFYLGYYVHLMTDIMWSEKIYITSRKKYSEEFEKNPEFLKVIKQDWNDLDFKFLKENPDYHVYKVLCGIDSVKDYLPYYEPGQLTVQTKFIADFYKGERNFNREHKYLNGKTVDKFIKTACRTIEKDIKDKNLAKLKK